MTSHYLLYILMVLWSGQEGDWLNYTTTRGRKTLIGQMAKSLCNNPPTSQCHLDSEQVLLLFIFWLINHIQLVYAEREFLRTFTSLLLGIRVLWCIWWFKSSPSSRGYRCVQSRACVYSVSKNNLPEVGPAVNQTFDHRYNSVITWEGWKVRMRLSNE